MARRHQRADLTAPGRAREFPAGAVQAQAEVADRSAGRVANRQLQSVRRARAVQFRSQVDAIGRRRSRGRRQNDGAQAARRRRQPLPLLHSAQFQSAQAAFEILVHTFSKHAHTHRPANHFYFNFSG